MTARDPMQRRRSSDPDRPLTASVVIATYNRPLELDRLLRCLADQEYPPLEVIVVDDGSEPAARPDFPEGTQWQCLRQPNAGPAAARHAGIERASGDVVIVVDDDMIVTQRFVSSHMERHALGDEVVQGRFDNRNADTRPLFDRFVDAQQSTYFDRCALDPSAVEPARLSTGNVSVRRSLYLDSGGFDTSLRRREDTELGIRLAERGARFGFVAERTAVHDEPPESLQRWLRVAYEYGTSEAALAAAHPDTYNPWALLDDMPTAARRLVTATMRWPRLMTAIGRSVARAGGLAETLHLQSVAVRGYGAGFALHWFGGMSEAFGPSARRAAAAARAIGTHGVGLQRVMFGGVGVDVIGLDAAVDRIIALSADRRPHIVVTPNVDHLVLYRRDSTFASVYDRASLVLADGAPLILLSRVLRLPLRDKVSGSDLVQPLVAAASRSNSSLYLLGATDEVTQAASARMSADHPELRIVGRSSPMFRRGEPNVELAHVLEQIRELGVDLVLLAFGTPKEQHLLDQFADQLPPACFVCCGASLDFVAGKVRRAPGWMSALGMEWIFRLAVEPRRLWKRYLVQDVAVLPLFVSMAVRRLLGRRLVQSHPLTELQ